MERKVAGRRGKVRRRDRQRGGRYQGEKGKENMSKKGGYQQGEIWDEGKRAKLK